MPKVPNHETTPDEPATRMSARAMLALIALAVDLPLPATVQTNRYEYRGTITWTLTLEFRSIAAGLAWARHFGAAVVPYRDGCNRYLGHKQDPIDWNGWKVRLHAFEPVPEAGAPIAGLSPADQAALLVVSEKRA